MSIILCLSSAAAASNLQHQRFVIGPSSVSVVVRTSCSLRCFAKTHRAYKEKRCPLSLNLCPFPHPSCHLSPAGEHIKTEIKREANAAN